MALKGTQVHIWKFYGIHMFKSLMIGIWWYINLHDDIKDHEIAIKSSFLMTTMNIYGMCFIVHALLHRNVFQMYLYTYILGIECLLPVSNIVLFLANKKIYESIFSTAMVLCNLGEILYNVHVFRAAECEFFWYCSKRTGLDIHMKGKSFV
ncbi:hypothetical protein VCUG_00161 [Vavraia culicis subsp. floridensis]|uniref:Uncharacterized protein n=1 Tax=Vavraia culicis (isolate floridensis) TaxID=948595 RepID=L2GZ00_VAVCU|nr:uncharacterized protein VCUG_00161 [Vavraia culicis subsp. floridensis]ELA48325.1 hypothetical protein VCUG_00161 [Vavraia culicis subsp. floridensis]